MTQNLLRIAGTGNPGRSFRATLASMKDIRFAMDESGDVYAVKELRRDGLGSGTPEEAIYVLGDKIGRGHKCLPTPP